MAFGFNRKFTFRFLFDGNSGRAPGLMLKEKLSGVLIMTFGRGALLWLLGIPLPIILLLALFWR
jgi:hypothetical protein